MHPEEYRADSPEAAADEGAISLNGGAGANDADA